MQCCRPNYKNSLVTVRSGELFYSSRVSRIKAKLHRIRTICAENGELNSCHCYFRGLLFRGCTGSASRCRARGPRNSNGTGGMAAKFRVGAKQRHADQPVTNRGVSVGTCQIDTFAKDLRAEVRSRCQIDFAPTVEWTLLLRQRRGRRRTGSLRGTGLPKTRRSNP